MKALIVEDEEIVREILESVALREFEFDAVKGAGDGEQAWKTFAGEPFDFVVLDLMLPKLDGLALAKRMLSAVPEIRILALSSECDDYTVREIQCSGVLGFVDKSEMSLEVLFEAYNEVSAGHVYYSPNVQKKILEVWENPDAYYKILSDREFQVLRAVVMGQDKDEIAERLDISAFTVRRHRHNAMKKLNISDEAGLVRFALDKGIIKNKGGLNWTVTDDD
ncbi:MAG: response regulator transcription factor [Verrucomicrobiota bacterium]